MHHHKLTALAALLLSFALPDAGKRKSREAERQEKHEENIVTLTKENLQHVEIKAEPVTLGSIDMTLKAAGRVSANMNKTAKVSSTLEGRIVKLNDDLNDPVKAGDVLALVQTPELFGRPLEFKSPIDGVITERKGRRRTGGKDKEIYMISDPTDLWVIAEVKERDIGAVKVGQEAKFTVLAYPGENSTARSCDRKGWKRSRARWKCASRSTTPTGA